MKRNDTYIEGVLIMELATMVVAIALAFLASSLSTYSSQAIQTIVEFVIISTVVVWFWWSYVVERIEYPFKTFKFPFYDVLILITISLIPFVYKIGGIMYIAGLLSFLMFFWSLMLIEIKNEYIDSINEIERKIFNFEKRIVFLYERERNNSRNIFYFIRENFLVPFMIEKYTKKYL